MEGRKFFEQMMVKQLDICREKVNTNSLLSPHMKLNSKWVIELNIKTIIYKMYKYKKALGRKQRRMSLCLYDFMTKTSQTKHKKALNLKEK